jgi:hypothetical protein
VGTCTGGCLSELVGVLKGSHPLVCLADQLICTVAAERGSENVKKADVMQVLSLDVRVSVHCKDDSSRAVRSVDPEQLVDHSVVVSPLFPRIESRPPI